MVKIINCPLCNGGKLQIDVPQGQRAIFSGALKDMKNICVCKNCNRNVKYKLVKSDR